MLEKGRTVPIFGKDKAFDKPCHLVTKSGQRNTGYFLFAEPAPITPSRQLRIDLKTKVDISGDFDTKVQSCSVPMLSTIAEDTKAAVDLLPPGQQSLFFGSTTAQCDVQRDAYIEYMLHHWASWLDLDRIARMQNLLRGRFSMKPHQLSDNIQTA